MHGFAVIDWRRAFVVLSLVVLGWLGAVVAPAKAEPLIAAAGDIACDPTTASFNGGSGNATSCRQKYTSDRMTTMKLSAVLPLGDLQYECGGYSAFLQSYDPSWGRLKAITRPVSGNHEYQISGGSGCDPTQSAQGYFDYFGAVAGDRSKGYYSYNIGSWHIIALNSNCSIVSCSAGSPQEQWLRQVLAASTATCTLAYWHHPMFSSGKYNPGVKSVAPLFQALYDHRADVVLSGHDHIYERFAPQNPSGVINRNRGIRQFTVGTGGRSLHESLNPIANSEKRRNTWFGVLKLRLGATSYGWEFIADDGSPRDSGSDLCDGTSQDTTPPSTPPNLTGSAVASNLVDLNWSATADNVGVIGYYIYRNGTALASIRARTSFSDNSVAPGTTYTYEIRARDSAVNLSPPSQPVTVTTPPSTAAVAFLPDADARVEEADPGANFGTDPLRVDGGSPTRAESYLRFNVSGPSAPVRSAKLRVYAYGATVNGPAIYSTSTTWAETGITWSTRPARTSAAVDDKGAIPANSWVEYDVSSLVNGNGTYSFTLATTSTDGVDLYSREGPNLRPRLVLGY
jgi:hypothetical protein